MLIHGGKCSWIVKILLVRGDVISSVTGVLHYNARQFIYMLKVRGDVGYPRNPWTLTPMNKDDTSVYNIRL